MKGKSVDLGGALSQAFAAPVEEDSAPVNLLAGALARPSGSRKSPLESAPHLLAVREAVAALRAGTLDDEGFYKAISGVHQQISDLLGLFELPQVQQELATRPEEAQLLAETTRTNLEQIEAGLGDLVNYLESRNPDHLEEGLSQVEEGYLALDKTQDQALEMMGDSEEDDEDGEDE